MGGFCKYCVMHNNPSDPRAQKRPLVTAPFQELEKATGKERVLERHQKIQCHQWALEAGIAIIRSVKKPKETLPYRISTQNQEMFEKDMNALRAIISTIILCGKQNIPLRGHRDDSTSTASNKGNFHAILMLLGNSDKNLQEYLLVGEMLQTPQKLYKRKLFASLESIFGRKLHSRFRRKTLFSQSLAMR